MSRRAATVNLISRRAGLLPLTSDPALLEDIVEETIDFVFGSQTSVTTLCDIFIPFSNRGTEPFQTGIIFSLMLFQKPETFAYHFTGIAVSARSDTGFNELVEPFGQIHIACGHREL